MSDLPRQILCEIIRQKGNAFFEKEKEFRALINDLCRGDFKRERRCISDSITEGIPASLLKKHDRLPYEIISSQLTDRLISFGFDQNLARWTVDSWALALGIITEKYLYPKTCILSLASNPAGAKIFINDKFVGKAPVEILNVRAGHYKIKMNLPGFMPWQDVVDLSDGQNKTVHANLNKVVPDKGDFLIDSDPPGALIFIDSHHHGATPNYIKEITTGSHQITLKLKGYNDVTRYVTIYSGKNPDILEKLSIKGPIRPRTGNISIDTFPSNAEIYLDSTFVGLTPLVLKNTPVGTYHLTIRLDGFSDYSTTTKIEEGANSDIFWKFQKISPDLPHINWKTGMITIFFIAAIIFIIFGTIPIPDFNSKNSDDNRQMPPAGTTQNPLISTFFLPEGVIIEGNLAKGESKTYYFDVERPEIIQFIRIRVEGYPQTDYDFIIGKDYLPTFLPLHYDIISDIDLRYEQYDLYSPKTGRYYINLRNKGESGGYTLSKSIFYNK
jgi:hypothetical protein